MPALEFYWDDVVDSALRIESILDELGDDPSGRIEVIEQAIEIARGGTRFLVACHRRPDADSLGSALGLIRTLRALGKEATLFMPETFPTRFSS